MTSFWEKLRQGLSRTREGLLGPLRAAFQGEKNEELLSRLEEALLAADVGPEETGRVVQAVAEKLPARCTWEELLSLVEGVLLADLRGAERALSLPSELSVLLFVGVNGSGKTTTVAKVGHWLQREGRRPLLVAADTFRAAAIEQLRELGEAAGLPVVAQKPGADPGAVVHDALEHARASGYDVVLVDTAGRLQTKRPLMEELGKIRRVVEKMTGGPPQERILVVDATVGQNAISQAQLFHEAVGLTGLAVTKLDGTARGGAVLPVVRTLGLPILWVGTGKDLEDLAPFRAADFVRALLRGVKMAKYVYLFGAGRTEGSAKMKDLLGGKGANLAEMAALGIPVPPGFTLTTEVCRYYYKNGGKYPEGLAEQVREGMKFLEEATGRKFGDPQNPLLVSVRSGAPVSMPGMMDTILNLGLTDRAVEGLAARTSPRFAYDAYRRLLSMYGSVVLGIKDEIDPFGEAMEELKRERGAASDLDLTAEDFRELVARYKDIIKKAGKEFPQDPWEQLWGAIEAVVRSWMNERARVYRRMYRIPEDMGTAVNVQAMVFGNLGNRSGTGVCFTRDPATGENRLYGEFLLNAQGEDVVAGIRTPNPIAKSAKTEPTQISLEEAMPEVYQELLRIREVLERHYRDMQDVEFTIEEGKLYILQTRSGKRTGFAAVRIAVEMAEEGLITEDEAILRIDPAEQLSQLLQPIFDPKAKARAKVLAKGLAAGPGAATGRIALSAQRAEEMAKEGPVILVRHETSPDDIRGMAAAQGILTARGGLTSHAAVVARQIGKVAVVGCEALHIDYGKREIRVAGEVLREGDWLSIDGTTGEVLLGKIPTQPSEVVQVLITKTLKPEEAPIYRLFEKLMRWADARRRLGVRANADQPDQAAIALAFGAEGIGLCRTEHMFFAEDRISYMQEALVAPSPEARKRALLALQRMQTQDFEGILRVMDGKPVIIRLLDPPMHEFLPREDKDIRALAERLGMRFEELKAYIESLQEFNPMLGHRGVRLGITHPDLYDMQVEAIFRAAAKLKKEGLNPKPEVMIPLVGHVNEMKVMRERVVEIAKRVMAEEGVEIHFKVGTMVEVPRAAITADEIAKEAEFFSFGTNDLTQMTFGFSRDDAGKFIREYLERRILPEDPFETLDRNGVGELMRLAVEKGRRTRPDLSVGICGEHGGESRSVHLCHELGLDYVSASPWRIPVARLAAAQAAIRKGKAEVVGD